MARRHVLPLVNICHDNRVPEIQAALLRYGAFRFKHPDNLGWFSDQVFREARDFFRQSIDKKAAITGYSPQGGELVRQKLPIYKESRYFLRNRDKQGHTSEPADNLQLAVMRLHEAWGPTRKNLLDRLSQALNPNIPLSGEEHLDYVSLAVHYYDPQKLHGAGDNFTPSHVDSGSVSIILTEPGVEGLEIADLKDIKEGDSGAIDKVANFIPVPTLPLEAVGIAGLRMRRMFGKNVRPGVHKVRHTETGEERFSIVMFCAAS
ncbi:hypothetical protein BDV12DRAFT_177509 [Aspergillus spectabilis]